MSVNLLTDISVPKPQINCRCWDLIVDGDSNIMGNATVGGNVTIDGTITINGSVNIPSGALSISDLAPGPAGNSLVTDAFGTEVIWSPLPPIVVPPGPARSIFQTNSTGGGTEWNTDLIVPGNATVVGDLAVGDEITGNSIVGVVSVISNGTMTSTGLLRTLADLQVDNNATITNTCTCEVLEANIVNCTTLNTTGDIFCGDDISVNDSATINGALTVIGTSLLTGNVSCSGNLSLTGPSSTLTAGGKLDAVGNTTLGGSLDLAGNLKFNAVSGASGSVVYKTGATTQAWSQLSTLILGILPSARRDSIYCLATGVQNLVPGSSVSPIVITWDAAFLTESYSYGSIPYTGVTQSSSTTWLINTGGLFMISWKLNLNGTGIGTTQIWTRVLLNGSVIGPKSPSTYGITGTAQTVFSAGSTMLNLSAGNTIGLGGYKSAGSDVLSTIPADSYISINLLSTLF